MMQDVYSKKDLMEALKRVGVPWSYRSILKYERLGVFERSDNPTGNRLYTKKDIEDIVAKVVAYKRK